MRTEWSSVFLMITIKFKPWRTLAYHEVILRIGPLAKQCKQKISAVDSKRPSLPSGPILSITSVLMFVPMTKSTEDYILHLSLEVNLLKSISFLFDFYLQLLTLKTLLLHIHNFPSKQFSLSNVKKTF